MTDFIYLAKSGRYDSLNSIADSSILENSFAMPCPVTADTPTVFMFLNYWRKLKEYMDRCQMKVKMK